MEQIQILSNKVRVLCFFALAFALALLPSKSPAQQSLQQNAIAGVSCANSANGTAHVLCLEELSNPNGSGPLLGGFSWQSPNSPAAGNTGANGAPIEASTATTGVEDLMTDISMPAGPFTGTPACAAAGDGTGTAICAVEGSNNGLYGIAIHPQPLGNEPAQASPLVPLMIPGQKIPNTNTGSPCTPRYPCNQVAAIGGRPSCTPTEANEVICAVLVVLQNTIGTTINDLMGIAFDPRQPASATNPAIQVLANGNNFYSNPSCASSSDPNKVVNGGKMFATCAAVFVENYFGAQATLFGAPFDPRSGYNRGALTVSGGSTDFSQDPSCGTPIDGSGVVICAIGQGDGTAYGTGTSSTMLGVAFNPIARTTSTINLGAPPAGDGVWASFGCASPVDVNHKNSMACIGITSNNQVLSIDFDPRTGTDPITGGAPSFQTVAFTDPNGVGIASVPSCVPEFIINDQIQCVVVDAANDAVGFAARIQ